MTPEWLTETPDGVTVHVRVQPRASRDGVAGTMDGALRIRLQAPPVEGKANRALLRFIADATGVPPRQVALLAGVRGRRKTVRITGVTAAQVKAALIPAPVARTSVRDAQATARPRRTEVRPTP